MSARRRRRGGLTAALLLFMLAAVFTLFVAPGILRRLNYPVLFEREIRLAAGEADLPPALVAAVALTESGYREKAVSRAGALGLMQIMPDTGGWIAGKLGETDTYASDDMLNAACALRYGCWYLRFLLMRYQGDIACAAAAYHAGQGTVDRWLADESYSLDGRTLSAFPQDAPKTSQYVKKVLKAYEYYLEIYQ